VQEENMESQYVNEHGNWDEIAASTVTSGEVVQLSDGRTGVKLGLQSAASGDAISYATQGIYKFDSASGTLFTIGDPVYWDASANKAVPKAATLDGGADLYLGTAIAAKTSGQTTVTVDLNVLPQWPGVICSQPFDFDCQTGVDEDLHTLIPAAMNHKGLLILGVYGRITEAMVGSSEDQGVITIADDEDSPNTLGTLTPSDGAADSIGDVIAGSNNVLGGATGLAVKQVAAGQAVTGQVTQATSGGSPAGKVRVWILAVPLI
jgi:predicted RecA/RadA family phage recombinase